MPISRSQLLKELVPGLHALFGMQYARYENQHLEIFEVEGSDRAFEEEVLLVGFGAAPVKGEGQGIVYDEAAEAWTARYTHETIALGFAITEEAMEDNLYDKLSVRYTKALARGMAYTKQVKAANVINNATTSGYNGGDGVVLASASHPLSLGGTFSNVFATHTDLSETALETAVINVAGFVDERGIPIAVKVEKLVIPQALVFVAKRILGSPLRPGTSDNDINAVKELGAIPEGYTVNNFFTSTVNWFVKTDIEDGFKMFQRAQIKTAMEGDFETGNVRYKARERYSFGWSDPRCMYFSG